MSRSLGFRAFGSPFLPAPAVAAGGPRLGHVVMNQPCCGRRQRGRRVARPASRGLKPVRASVGVARRGFRRPPARPQGRWRPFAVRADGAGARAARRPRHPLHLRREHARPDPRAGFRHCAEPAVPDRGLPRHRHRPSGRVDRRGRPRQRPAPRRAHVARTARALRGRQPGAAVPDHRRDDPHQRQGRTRLFSRREDTRPRDRARTRRQRGRSASTGW